MLGEKLSRRLGERKAHTEEARLLDLGVELWDLLDQSFPRLLSKVEMVPCRHPRLFIDVETELT